MTSSSGAPLPFVPDIGRQVHYVSYGTPGGEYESTCRAATITEVRPNPHASEGELPIVVSLCVMNPTGLFFKQGMRQGTAFGEWHYYTDCPHSD